MIMIGKSIHLFTIIGIVSIVIQLIETKSAGAPFESCLTLTPKHGTNPPQPSHTSPFVVNATQTIDENEGERVEIVIWSPFNRTTFRGFVVQARYANNPDMIVDGEFSPNEAIQSRVYCCRPSENIHNNVFYKLNTIYYILYSYLSLIEYLDASKCKREGIRFRNMDTTGRIFRTDRIHGNNCKK